ncbi:MULTISPECIES: hypothetical protein [unclassified Colwellia]|uniref:hypothetical protein n=1 Tax=unclassified Colwellia TaxID=196834 RepID=UPI0015F5FDD2|nr:MULTISPECIES: hypothetical protein [unclassified Colwellia]MBA6234384.1 hypothetical protein [Colwellia sp. MB02u-7]MBA6237552.1 hypothetical protein [Colwellia sp. MB02u-11]MBA6256253.1 hypothetical protein [Colwellia sp. MB3u-28]MBA6260137.1 hypothetical protein [Colwellia sp. MB3u-41]MBA6300184.1 hypothetical protein [Colwellia sp. MB3u-22]
MAALKPKGLKDNLSTCRLEGLHSRAFGCFQRKCYFKAMLLWKDNNMGNIEITVGSDLDYESLIAEIKIDGAFVGIVTNEPDESFKFEIQSGQVSSINVELETYIKALNDAKSELLK